MDRGSQIAAGPAAAFSYSSHMHRVYEVGLEGPLRKMRNQTDAEDTRISGVGTPPSRNPSPEGVPSDVCIPILVRVRVTVCNLSDLYPGALVSREYQAVVIRTGMREDRFEGTHIEIRPRIKQSFESSSTSSSTRDPKGARISTSSVLSRKFV